MSKNCFGVKKSNLIIYASFFLLGVLSIIIGIIMFHTEYSGLLYDDVFLSLGSGIIPAVGMAYLIDRANEKREQERKIEMRKTSLWGLPYGVFWIAKTTIEMFGNFGNVKGKTLEECLMISFNNMDSMRPENVDNGDILAYQKIREDYIERINYGISLYSTAFPIIASNRIFLQSEGIFTEDEYIILQSFEDELSHVIKVNRIDEIAEYLKVHIQYLTKVKEIGVLFQKPVVIEKNRLMNTTDFQKVA